MDRLTKQQQAIYDYIADYIRLYGYPPSVREIGSAVGLSSPSSVHKHLHTLEAAGYITRDTGKTRAIILNDSREAGVPILGAVAAGQPILAVEDALGYLPLQLSDPDLYFALKISGDSMMGAGILDGDMVIVRRQSTAENGEIVIALLGEEATCKRLKRTDGRVLLLPENPAFAQFLAG